MADALVGEIKPALRKQLLNVAIAQREAQIKPNRVLDDSRRETMPVIRDRRHAAAYDRFAPTARVTLTMPGRCSESLTDTGIWYPKSTECWPPNSPLTKSGFMILC